MAWLALTILFRSSLTGSPPLASRFTDAQVAAGSFLCGDWNSIFCAVSSRSLDPSVSEQLWCGEASGGAAEPSRFLGELPSALLRHVQVYS